MDTTWKVQREAVLLLGWGRAILLQLAHPLVAAGVADHSGFLTDRRGRWRRFYWTLDAMLRLSFGPPDETARAVRGINAIHLRVHGRLREAAGIFPAGTEYSARDPQLLGWVHATLLDSFLLAYQLYVEPLTPAEQDAYCAEASRIAPWLGIPDGLLPVSRAQLDGELAARQAGGEIAITETARTLARELVTPAGVVLTRPVFWLNYLPTVGLLPPALRQAYGFGWGPRRERALRVSAACVRGTLGWTPSIVRHWPSARTASRRARAEAAVA